MIRRKSSGFYKLIETKSNTKILYMDNDVYAWLEPRHIGEILVTSHKLHHADCMLGIGRYHLYEVKDEPSISDNMHLELEVGRDIWQGYLLLTGLPDDSKKRARIIPTHEIITGNPKYKNKIMRRGSLTAAT